MYTKGFEIYRNINSAKNFSYAGKGKYFDELLKTKTDTTFSEVKHRQDNPEAGFENYICTSLNKVHKSQQIAVIEKREKPWTFLMVSHRRRF